jgi:hypothetical protein
MAKAPTSSSSKLISLMFVVVALIGGYFLSPMFLPTWRWKNVDFKQMAITTGKKESVLSTIFNVEVRYHPRNNNSSDPAPWQVLTMDPMWHTVDKNNENEENLAVRCTFISERTGSPLPAIYLGGTYKDRYFKCKAYRFPPGSFGQVATRPVLVFLPSTLDKMSIGVAQTREAEVKEYFDNDDEWDDRNDFWPPQ